MQTAAGHRQTSGAPVLVHVAVLAAGLGVLAAAAARGWFFYDDWYFLRQLPEAIWAPHVGHWNAGGLVFVALGVWWLFTFRSGERAALPGRLLFVAAPHGTWAGWRSRLSRGPTASTRREPRSPPPRR